MRRTCRNSRNYAIDFLIFSFMMELLYVLLFSVLSEAEFTLRSSCIQKRMVPIIAPAGARGTTINYIVLMAVRSASKRLQKPAGSPRVFDMDLFFHTCSRGGVIERRIMAPMIGRRYLSTSGMAPPKK